MRLLIVRVRPGRPVVAHVAAGTGISRVMAHMWVRRRRAEGERGLHDRSSRRPTHRTPAGVPAVSGPQVRSCACLGPVLGLPASTTHRILTRPAFLDRPTGLVIRRFERDRPGELVHVDARNNPAGQRTKRATFRAAPTTSLTIDPGSAIGFAATERNHRLPAHSVIDTNEWSRRALTAAKSLSAHGRHRTTPGDPGGRIGQKAQRLVQAGPVVGEGGVVRVLAHRAPLS